LRTPALEGFTYGLQWCQCEAAQKTCVHDRTGRAVNDRERAIRTQVRQYPGFYAGGRDGRDDAAERVGARGVIGFGGGGGFHHQLIASPDAREERWQVGSLHLYFYLGVGPEAE